MITWLLAVVVALGLGATVRDLVASPVTRRLATRSIARRPAEAMLVVLGSMFGTAIIGAAFIVGDSFNLSNRDVARRELGPIDIAASIRPDADLDANSTAFVEEVRSALGGSTGDSSTGDSSTGDGVDGVLAARTSAAVLDNLRRDERQQIIPNSCVAEFDLDDARGFGPDPEIGGLVAAGDTPGTGEAIVGSETARRLDIEEGDTLAASLYGTTLQLRARTVVETVGLAGYCDAIVAPGTISDAWAAAATVAANPDGSPTPGVSAGSPPSAEVLVSLTGGVFDALGPTTAVAERLEAALRASTFSDAEVRTLKQDRLERADQQGENLRSIFSGIGGFSVISGILLLINLVVMLAEERKVELGVLRAVGLKRRRLIASFSLEGSLYALASSVLGAAVAVGIGALVIIGTRQIFSDPNRSFETSLHVRPLTLATSAAIGYSISMVTIWLASARIARLNIISAVRDLPDPRTNRRRSLMLAIAIVIAIVGIGLSVVGARSAAQIPLLIGVPIAAFALIGVTARLLPRAVGAVGWSTVAIAWILGAFVLFEDTMQHAGIGVFVMMGVLLVAAAVVIAVAVAPFLASRARSLRGDWALAARLGFAYPLSHTVRTGLLLGMFSLVIFTMTFMASLAATIDDQATSGARDVSAGYDLLVWSSPSNPLTRDVLAKRPEVDDVAMFAEAGPEFSIRYQQEFTRWRVTGFDRSLLAHGVPKLTDRSRRFRSDTAAFEAVLADPSLIILGDQFLLRGGGPKTDGPEVGDRVIIRNPAGDERTLTVAGVLGPDFAGHGALWPTNAVTDLLAPRVVQSKAFVRVADGRTSADAARSLQLAFATSGAEVTEFTTLVAEELDDTTSFMRLLEVYLAFGLLIGIAGLGVVMVRAARERRREIAMLRAMGTSARVIYRSFLVEAFFISALGATIGVTLAVVTAYQVVVNSSAFSLSSDTFTIPWWPMVIVSAVPIGASLLAAVQPARVASRVRPAVALRVSD